MAAFEEFGVMPEIAKAVEDMNWTLPTEVQSETIPLILGGGDVLMAAETGSGKTGAFCLPVIQIVWESLKDLKSGGKKSKAGSTSQDKDGAQSEFVMSVYDRAPNLAIAPNGLKCQSRHQKEWHGCRATKGVIGEGRVYFEAIVEDEGLCRVGFSTAEASLDLGTCKYGFGFGGTGKKSNNRQFDDFGEAFGKGDVIGCYLDLNNMEISYTKNGRDLGLAFEMPNNLKNKPFFPAVVLKNAEMSFNFGDQPWKHPPVEGFQGLTSIRSRLLVSNEKNSSNVAERKLIPNAPQAIIIEPSRELAEQTFNQLQLFKKHLGEPHIRELLVVGGVNSRDQVAALKSGIDIAVATPGRLEDLLSNSAMSVKQCRFFILDEADGLLKAGYEQMINRIYNQIPKMTSDGTRLQMVVCSATLHDFNVKKLADRLMHFPVWVDLKGRDSVPETVHHVVLNIDPQDKSEDWRSLERKVPTDGVHFHDNVNQSTPEGLSQITKLLKTDYCLQAIRKLNITRGILFCRTKLDCDNLEKYLKRNGGKDVSCVCLHGDKKPDERKANLQRFKDEKVNFLICTDVAARGIDVKGLPYLVNVNLPEEQETYVHRIGRVGRAERMGLAVSLVSKKPEKVWYHGSWCPSRGRNCNNTNLTTEGGCCVYADDQKSLGQIEEHLGSTIPQIGKDFQIQVDEFDGKVVYGDKKKDEGTRYEVHVDELHSVLGELQRLEKQAQRNFLNQFCY